MLEATTSFATGRRRSASSSTAVPRLLISTYFSISYMLCPTPTAEAKWNTASTPASARSTSRGSRTSPFRSPHRDRGRREIPGCRREPARSGCRAPAPGSPGQQSIGEVRADEARAAGDEHSFQCLTRSTSKASLRLTGVPISLRRLALGVVPRAVAAVARAGAPGAAPAADA